MKTTRIDQANAFNRWYIRLLIYKDNIKQKKQTKKRMSICEIIPDDPSCISQPDTTLPPEPEMPPPVIAVGEDSDVEEVEVEVVEKVEEMDHSTAAKAHTCEWRHIMDFSGMAMMNPFMSNLSYFGVAAMSAAYYAMQALRYRSPSTYYDAAKIGDGTNWWAVSDAIRLWGGLGITGLLAVTQLLATFDIAVGLNGTMWMLVGGLGGMALMAVVDVMRFIGWEAGYSAMNDTTKPTEIANGIAMMKGIEYDTVHDMIMSVTMMLGLYGRMNGWYYSLWNSATDEE